MVLAAGLGTRMRARDPHLPKPLIRLKGRTLLDRVLDRIAAAGIARAVVNVHYKADQIEAHLAGRVVPKIVISDERAALLDTGGGVKNALPLLGRGPILRHNSDSVWREDKTGNNMAALCRAFNPSTMECLLLLAPRVSALGYDGRGDFHLDDDGRVRRCQRSETADYVFAGADIFDPHALAEIPDAAFSLNRLWDRALAAGRAYGLVLDGQWMHVGTPEAHDAAEALLERLGDT
jgi:N-acetyl-alpha-D-muramate 1-phosphate uridylyltransferase